MARGRYVAFLDADDWWDSRFLSTMLRTLEATGAGLAYCGWQNIGLPGPRGAPYLPPDYEGPEKIPRLLANAGWPIHAALTRRDLLLEAGGFPEDLDHSEDFLLWLEIAVRTVIVRVPQVLAYYRHHRGPPAVTRKAALSHLAAQRRFLRRHPEVVRSLGRQRMRAILRAELRRRAYEAYWARDLPTARPLFRRLLFLGVPTKADLIHQLPCWLPRRLHEVLLCGRDRHSDGIS